jgi:ABC-2 type transport system permease protein
MFTIFRHAFARARGQVLGWGIALGLTGASVVWLYSTVASQRQQYAELLKDYPPEMMALFGGVTEIYTPVGYLTMAFFSYIPIIVGIYAVLAGSGLLAADEENGTLDLVLAHPISRTQLFLGRLLAFVGALLAITALTWLGFALLLPGSDLDISLAQLALPFLSLFAVLLVFGALALALSQLLPSRSAAATASGMVLVASYFLSSLASVNEGLRTAARLLPLHYYQGGAAIEGLNWGWLAALLAAAALLSLAAWGLFQRRDIRVGGEGGWRLPALGRRG